MVAEFILTFRETLEAALIVGIILAYLTKINEIRFKRYVWYGVIAAIAGSIVSAVLFKVFFGGFEGRAEEIFEGITMLVAAGLITYMIFWMLKNKDIQKKFHRKVHKSLIKSSALGIFLLVFVNVLREGIETVIFLNASVFNSGVSVLSASLGIIAAAFLGFLIFKGFARIKLKVLFNITGVLLILFAAGLVAHGIHELQEAHALPVITEHVWDINPPQNPDGSYPLLHEDGAIGSFLAALLGYNGNPSLIEVLGYVIYLIIILFIYRGGKHGV